MPEKMNVREIAATHTSAKSDGFSSRLKKLDHAFNEAKAKAPLAPVTIPTGHYPAKLVKAELGETSDGLLMFTMTYIVLDDGDDEDYQAYAYVGQVIARRFVLEGPCGPKHMEYLLGDLSKFGYSGHAVMVDDLEEVGKALTKDKAQVDLLIKEADGYYNAYLNRVLTEADVAYQNRVIAEIRKHRREKKEREERGEE